MRTALTAELLYTPLETVADPILLIEDGHIERVGSSEAIELPRGVRMEAFPGAILAPGFIDVHMHGGAGHDVMEATPEALAAIEQMIAAHGATSYCPTTVTAPLDTTFAALERLADHIETRNGGGLRAQPLGVHLEGPFISHAKRGVHPPEYIQPASVELFTRLYNTARGHVVLMTVAPELPGACELIAEAMRHGVTISLGHSDADLDAAHAGIAAGARHTTHTFNAMRALDHRAPGLLGAVLTDDRLSAEVIADGIHVHPDVVALFLRAKGPDRAVLVTDALSATGMPDGRYRLGSFEVEVTGGRCLADGRLAGSVLTLDRAVRNVMEFADWDLRAAVQLATLNPARVLGLEARKGLLAPGADADLVVLNRRGEVIKTIVAGAL